jgi:hypothetical protein
MRGGNEGCAAGLAPRALLFASRSPVREIKISRIRQKSTRLCQAMIDIVLGAGIFEGMRPSELSSLQGGLDVRRSRARIAWRGEVGSVVGEDGVDLVRNGGDQAAQEIRGGPARHLFVQFDEGELRGPVDCHNEIEPALSGSDLGDVDMEIADRIGLEVPLG